ncbi:hypothetical protein H7F50_18860 [Novosphingobium flavum]|uniref:vWA domain-containing protein n=1 Tax=Novosphingobium aerophilum TaxID=2839843 RepID=UPI00163AF922|nr:vWA domain-containing protein [Novosphingobium aerophilum]MBC2663782.1 hypothetical protein [Novosphingobium aerophilum]
MNQEHFIALYRELIDDNPFAVRAVLRILEVNFTDSVPTLAVSCEAQPRFLVNPDFIAQHCHTENHVKAVIVHEFLHVLLRHTENAGLLTRARHIAFDAVINAIICRTQGEDWASFFRTYYARADGITKLLRPPTPSEQSELWRIKDPSPISRAWLGIYQGTLVADDIAELAEEVARTQSQDNGSLNTPGEAEGHGDLIGNHHELGGRLPGAIADALEEAMREMTGAGIWRNQRTGLGHAQALADLEQAAKDPVRQWEKATLEILRRHVLPDPKARRIGNETRSIQLPVLSPGDRRAFVRSLWDPILPQAQWDNTVVRKGETAQVYLDVSGSMNTEMPALIALLARLSGHIRRPFWAFSDDVVPARIKAGKLVTSTTGGTSMACVLRHVIETRPRAAVVVTDGFIEGLDPDLVVAARSAARLHAVIARHGSPAALKAAGIPYTQLQRYPS